MSDQLKGLKHHATTGADTGDLWAIKRLRPREALVAALH